MWLQIFDVEHGACALLTADNGARLMIRFDKDALVAGAPANPMDNIRVAPRRSSRARWCLVPAGQGDLCEEGLALRQAT